MRLFVETFNGFYHPMAQTIYHDLAEFGLPFVTPERSDFTGFLEKIRSRPQPFGPPPTLDKRAAAVLLNRSGQAIIAFSYIWKYTAVKGQDRTSRHSNFGSSLQMDVLCGLAQVPRDWASFILPGSKRLLTEEGVFGDNLDVLPPDTTSPTGGFIGAGASGFHRRNLGDEVKLISHSDDSLFYDVK